MNTSLGFPDSTGEKSDLRILCVEDSALDAELILDELRQHAMKFEVCLVQSRAAFETALVEFLPNIILADYKLPGFDGSQALALARSSCPTVPVIIVSGAVGEETAVELLKNGATDFVLKDRLVGRLVPAVQRALREVAERNARQQAEADLRVLNEQLEARVADRTRELNEKNRLMKEDMDMARELQFAFLPHHFPTLPSNAAQGASAVNFYSLYQPTTSVSGDFFNVLRVSETAVGVFICDVMGHGVRAALVTTMMRALEKQLVDKTTDPGALLTEINRTLYSILQQSGTTLFTTACYLVADIATGRLTFANAGHPSPFLVRAAPGGVEPVSERHTAGPALGLFEDVQYLTHARSLAAGDLIFAFTDGLFEVENASAEAFSVARLRDSIRRHTGLPTAQLVQDVFAEAKVFAQGQTFSDDVCIVGMEIAHLNAA